MYFGPSHREAVGGGLNRTRLTPLLLSKIVIYYEKLSVGEFIPVPVHIPYLDLICKDTGNFFSKMMMIMFKLFIKTNSVTKKLKFQRKIVKNDYILLYYNAYDYILPPYMSRCCFRGPG